ncbi:pantoate--beta-alanine ligase [Wukongibacter sp. M2B1]|uniref:pantoate--beta-alanine ligase n=1 Tax=Wukongibacter sp. M2B1 TaxID=3088895 RepID=UPI003D7AC421
MEGYLKKSIFNDNIKVLRTIKEVRAEVNELKKRNKVIGLVPTMGALHDGHFELVKRSIEQCDYTIATIFVNPIQFGPNEDFSSYPRQEEKDIDNLDKLRCDAVFVPTIEELFPDNISNPHEILTVVSVKKLTEGLCGKFRPGHFDGMSTEVLKTFMIVMPDIAYFGEKDYQQLMIVKQMVRDLNLPICIEAVPTVREADGLAISSRNAYLTGEQRLIAPKLYTQLLDVSRQLSEKGIKCLPVLEKYEESLLKNGFDRIEYIAIVDKDKLTPVEYVENEARLLAAVWIGDTRLIDNVPIIPE